MEVAEKKIKVLIADDHEIFLLGLNSLFKKNENYEVVGVVSDAQDIFSVVEKTKPDLLIIDFLMPGANGIDVVQMLKAKISGLKSILISNIEDKSIINLCREVGIDGFVSKTEPKENLLNAIESVLRGEKYFFERAEAKLDFDKIRSSIQNPFHKLSPKELEFISYFTNGLTYTEIAQKMDISDRTVNTHRVNVTRKLGKLTLGQLINLARAWGLSSI